MIRSLRHLPRGGRADAPVISGSASARAGRAGALTSVLSLRYLWAKLRGVCAQRERRAAIMDEYHLRSAEQVVELMGNMKGLFMKLGQIVSFVSDDVPEQYRTVLRQLQTTSPPMRFDLARRVIESELSAPPQHSTARVLTQRFAGGHGFEWLLAQSAAFRQRIAEILFRFVFGSIFRFHIFNADPHPGNYRFHEDGAVTFLDFGCVKQFPPEMVVDWMEIIRAHLARADPVRSMPRGEEGVA